MVSLQNIDFRSFWLGIINVVDETSGTVPHFTLRKWRTCEDKKSSIEEEEDVQGLHKQPSSNLRHRGFSGIMSHHFHLYK